VSRQKLGQHFLVRASILDRIAAAACPGREPLVIEIGPGKGALTARLLDRADRVIAIELDEALARQLRQKLPDPRLEIVTADVLQTDLNQWGPSVVAGNLPYYISTAIFSRVLAPGSLLSSGVFLVQKEVAERITAAPGSRDYGYLSVEANLFADVKSLFDVRPGAFHPPPKVDSSLIGFMRRDRSGELGIDCPAKFLEFVRLCFRQKRKTLRNNLSAFYPDAPLAEWPEGRLRAEQFSLERIAALYRRLVG
jgi:16S rRNA (adenine1518-N6/adenine1519-N6)-dimethyltransferase